MPISKLLILLTWLQIFFFANCRPGKKEVNWLTVQKLPNPTQAGSGEPNLFSASDGRTYLSWIEPGMKGRHALRFSVFENSAWSPPLTISEGDNWFVNWADFPGLVASGDGHLAAHWLAKSSRQTYAYEIKIAQSIDGGTSWGDAVVPHADSTPTEHGFVSMLPWDRDRLFVAWLDGRNFAKTDNWDEKHGSVSKEMTLRFAFVGRDGRLSDERVLDPRVCECCQTSAARTDLGAVVAYRDRSVDEVRDIGVVRIENGVWSEPEILHADNWQINGCPVNGPAVAARGKSVVVAWFTAANDTPRVKVAFSNDGGKTFSTPFQVNAGETVGRVDLVLLADGAAVVSWLASEPDGGEVRLRRIYPDGQKSTIITLSEISTERASGFPRMVQTKNAIYFAWTQAGNPATVKTAVAELYH